MHKSFLIFVLLVTVTSFCFGQSTTTDTVKVATQGDTNEYSFSAGFYLTIPDDSKAQGFRLVNTDEFYYVATEYAITFRHLDTVYKEFDRNFKCYVLTFKFDTVGTKELLDFTMKYQGRKIGLLLDNNLISVATILSAIEYGTMSFQGKFTEAEIDSLKIEIENATREIKMRRSTIRRRSM